MSKWSHCHRDSTRTRAQELYSRLRVLDSDLKPWSSWSLPALTRTSASSTAPLSEITVRIRGPVTKEYTAINHEQHTVHRLSEEVVKMAFDRAHLLQPRGPRTDEKGLQWTQGNAEVRDSCPQESPPADVCIHASLDPGVYLCRSAIRAHGLRPWRHHQGVHSHQPSAPS
jgi:hypothetical protein